MATISISNLAEKENRLSDRLSEAEASNINGGVLPFIVATAAVLTVAAAIYDFGKAYAAANQI